MPLTRSRARGSSFFHWVIKENGFITLRIFILNMEYGPCDHCLFCENEVTIDTDMCFECKFDYDLSFLADILANFKF
ncbi:MAG: hypothetical protein EB127_21515 [Alphaproteobacteria bacterium]|nr:hypothetical protein [Alphaproteobacteria bacterium]